MNKMNKKIFVLGGDLRQLKCAASLEENGNEVTVYGLGNAEGMNVSENPEKDISEADLVLLPLPVTYDNVNINAPLIEEKLPLKLVYDNITSNTIIFGGMINENVRSCLIAKEILDYAKDGEFLVKNAMITAEGAFQIIFSETPISVCGSNFLVAGYGRIGKAVAKAASAFGAKVAVAARKSSDFAWIELNGYTPYKYKNLETDIGKFDIIVNTVPCRVFDEKIIKNMNKNALFTDLASYPGGCDMKDMQSAGIKAIHALSLPGKVAPYSSGKIISDTVINMTDKD